MTTYEIPASALNARNTQRADDMLAAAKTGKHFWVAGALYRVSGPSDDLLLDAENLCGYTPVHCAMCGADTNDDPICHSLG